MGVWECGGMGIAAPPLPYPHTPILPYSHTPTMATLREIRTRIRTVRNIQKITRAMKLVAAARLKRAQDRVQSARPYAERMEQMMRRLSAAGAEVEHPLLEVREERNIAVLIISS